MGSRDSVVQEAVEIARAQPPANQAVRRCSFREQTGNRCVLEGELIGALPLSCAVKNHMIEKKLILCGILAIAIGVAAVVPMEYMMAAQAQENVQTAQTQAKANAASDVQASVQPLFSDVNITYAYCNPNKISSNDTMTLYGSTIEAVVNFTLAPDALKNADAQIEYYKFAVSSDQGPIFNMGYYIVLEDNSDMVTGIGGSEGTIIFANGLTFNGPSATGSQDISFGCGGQDINYGQFPTNYTMGYVSHYIFGSDSNNLPQAASELQKRQNTVHRRNQNMHCHRNRQYNRNHARKQPNPAAHRVDELGRRSRVYVWKIRARHNAASDRHADTALAD